jgi:hypothetical protein
MPLESFVREKRFTNISKTYVEIDLWYSIPPVVVSKNNTIVLLSVPNSNTVSSHIRMNAANHCTETTIKYGGVMPTCGDGQLEDPVVALLEAPFSRPVYTMIA